MKILLTGGAGFIGSAVVRHIIQTTNDIVLNIDKLTYAGNLESLKEVDQNPRYQFQQVDICDSLKLEQAFEQFQPDAVMHLAAESHVDRSIDGPAAFIQTNIVGTYTLLEVARKYWQSLNNTKKMHSVFTISQLMKSMAISRGQLNYLLRQPPMHQVLLIQQVRRVQITWFALGNVLMVYQQS